MRTMSDSSRKARYMIKSICELVRCKQTLYVRNNIVGFWILASLTPSPVQFIAYIFRYYLEEKLPKKS